MTPNIATGARYGARLLALILAWAIAILSVTGAQFAELTRQDALVGLAIIVGGWLLHVAGNFADTGALPPDPPANAPPAPPAPPPPVVPGA